MAITITLQGQISITDGTSGAVALQKQVSATMVAGSSFSQMQSLAVGTSSTNLTLPVNPAQFFYLKNLHAIQTVTVTWTPAGGSSNVVVTLEPGSAIIVVETSSGGGLTAISLQASGASTPVEFIIGG